ncbi:MAG: protein jag, partial [Candidatus Eiseniibacteriota bacterium]
FERRDRADRGDRGGRDRPDRGDRPPRRPSTPLSPEERFQVDDVFLEKVRTEALWLLNRMGFEEATVTVAGEGDEVNVNLVSEADDSLLSGRRGDTRISIQQILSRLVNPRRGPGAHVIVDVNGYWQQRRDSLLERARALADRALETGEEMTTEPLASEERRLVHRALTADGRVVTESYGDGALKRIAIRPAEPA